MKTLLLASSLAILLINAPAHAQMIEYGKDRAGADITSFDLPPNGSPANCQGACFANTSCAAWTFVRAGWQGPAPRCWLKSSVPPAVDNVCCASGHK